MDNKKSLMTAGIVGVGGVALAYLAYNPDYHPHQRHMMTKTLLPD